MAISWRGGRASQGNLFGGYDGGAKFWRWTCRGPDGKLYALVVIGDRGEHRWGLREVRGEMLVKGTCETLKACREAAAAYLEGANDGR